MATSNKRPPEIPLSRTSPSYLHSNSTSHAWPFGAIAELIDNAYDPDVNATSIYIDCESISGYPCLTFTDDGNGLDLQQMHKMLSFGFSEKLEINGKRPIGVFGNGFKSGSMRLGKDAMVFSKKDDHEVIGFLSQTYLKKIKAEDIRIPIVDLKNVKSKDHQLSLTHIKEYSIFRSDVAINDQFSRISSTDGTRIVIYNLSREEIVDPQNGVTMRYELNCRKDQYDILIDNSQSVTKQMRGQQHLMDAPRCDFSLRAYCSVLYLNPKIRIMLRGKKVRTVLIAKSLQETEKDVYRPMGGNNKVKVTFGFNPKKHPYGVCFYHNNRLIKSYQRLGYQKNADHRGSEVVGIIDCNFLKPTQNKQDFQAGTAHRCIKAVGDKLNDYWNEKRENGKVAGPSHQFLGTTKVDTPDYTWVQCDRCSKFRKLPDSVDPDKLPDQWFCSMNKNLTQNNCNVPEEPEDSDDELMRPTYDKNYKKKEAEKKLQQKLVERMQQQERIREERLKNQKQVEKIKALEVQLANGKIKNSQEELHKLAGIENEIKQRKEEERKQKTVVDNLLKLKTELESQNQVLERRIADALKTEKNRRERKKHRTNGEKVECIWIRDSGDEEEPPPVKKVKAEPGTESVSAVKIEHCDDDMDQKPGCSTLNGSAANIKQEKDNLTSTKAVQTDFGNAEKKLTNLRGHVIRLLKMVMTEEGMHDVIENLEGDNVDEVLQDVMCFKDLD